MSAIRLARPMVDTPFQINMAWWERNRRDFMTFLRESSCPGCLSRFPLDAPLGEADYIDAETGEVRRLNDLWACIVEECAPAPGYIAPDLPIATAIFRALVSRGNVPLTPLQIHDIIQRSNPQTILRVLTGPTAILGILPVTSS